MTHDYEMMDALTAVSDLTGPRGAARFSQGAHGGAAASARFGGEGGISAAWSARRSQPPVTPDSSRRSYGGGAHGWPTPASGGRLEADDLRAARRRSSDARAGGAAAGRPTADSRGGLSQGGHIDGFGTRGTVKVLPDGREEAEVKAVLPDGSVLPAGSRTLKVTQLTSVGDLKLQARHAAATEGRRLPPASEFGFVGAGGSVPPDELFVLDCDILKDGRVHILFHRDAFASPGGVRGGGRVGTLALAGSGRFGGNDGIRGTPFGVASTRSDGRFGIGSTPGGLRGFAASPVTHAATPAGRRAGFGAPSPYFDSTPAATGPPSQWMGASGATGAAPPSAVASGTSLAHTRQDGGTGATDALASRAHSAWEASGYWSARVEQSCDAEKGCLEALNELFDSSAHETADDNIRYIIDAETAAVANEVRSSGDEDGDARPPADSAADLARQLMLVAEEHRLSLEKKQRPRATVSAVQAFDEPGLGDEHGEDSEIGAVRAEREAWALVYKLHGLRHDPAGGGEAIGRPEDAFATDLIAAEQMVAGTPAARLLHTVVEWLAASAGRSVVQQRPFDGLRSGAAHADGDGVASIEEPEEGESDAEIEGSGASRAMWKQTADHLRHRDGDAHLVKALDIDAPLRERAEGRAKDAGRAGADAEAHLAEDDELGDAELLHSVWHLVRAGHERKALVLCTQHGQPWRAASLDGGQQWMDRPVVDEADRLVGYDRIGNPFWYVWKSTCRTLAERVGAEGGLSRAAAEAATCERALYALKSGHAALLLGSPMLQTWEDVVWALCTIVRDAHIDVCVWRRRTQQLEVTRLLPSAGPEGEDGTEEATAHIAAVKPLSRLTATQVLNALDAAAGGLDARGSAGADSGLSRLKDAGVHLSELLADRSAIIQGARATLTRVQAALVRVADECGRGVAAGPALTRLLSLMFEQSGAGRQEVVNGTGLAAVAAAADGRAPPPFLPASTPAEASLLRFAAHYVLYLRALGVLDAPNADGEDADVGDDAEQGPRPSEAESAAERTRLSHDLLHAYARHLMRHMQVELVMPYVAQLPQPALVQTAAEFIVQVHAEAPEEAVRTAAFEHVHAYMPADATSVMRRAVALMIDQGTKDARRGEVVLGSAAGPHQLPPPPKEHADLSVTARMWWRLTAVQWFTRHGDHVYDGDALAAANALVRRLVVETPPELASITTTDADVPAWAGRGEMAAAALLILGDAGSQGDEDGEGTRRAVYPVLPAVCLPNVSDYEQERPAEYLAPAVREHLCWRSYFAALREHAAWLEEIRRPHIGAKPTPPSEDMSDAERVMYRNQVHHHERERETRVMRLEGAMRRAAAALSDVINFACGWLLPESGASDVGATVELPEGAAAAEAEPAPTIDALRKQCLPPVVLMLFQVLYESALWHLRLDPISYNGAAQKWLQQALQVADVVADEYGALYSVFEPDSLKLLLDQLQRAAMQLVRLQGRLAKPYLVGDEESLSRASME